MLRTSPNHGTQRLPNDDDDYDDDDDDDVCMYVGMYVCAKQPNEVEGSHVTLLHFYI